MFFIYFLFKIGCLLSAGILFYCISPVGLKCAELAIRYGADVNNRNKRGVSILVEACLCENGAKEINSLCLLLLEQGADVNTDNDVSIL